MFQSLGPHNPTLAPNPAVLHTAQESLALDNAFVLIDGAPGDHGSDRSCMVAGTEPWIVPIPGTRKLERLEENLGAVNIELTPGDLREIDAAYSKIKVQGARLSEDHMKLIDHAA